MSYTGGNYGKYKGISVEEIQRSFDACAGDPSHRSISAVLRITREQIESRGRLGMYPVAAGISALALAVILIVSVFVQPDLRDLLLKVAAAAAFGVVLFGFGSIRVRHTIKANLAEEKQILGAAADALNKIMSTTDQRKALLREQRETVKEIMAKSDRPGRVSELLEIE
jgi:hypothetical protein